MMLTIIHQEDVIKILINVKSPDKMCTLDISNNLIDDLLRVAPVQCLFPSLH